MILLIIISLIVFVQGNLYSPHVYPKKGPYFEGWYLRLNTQTNYSYGFLFGKVLPKELNKSVNLNYLSIVRSKGDGKPMESYDVFP